MIHLEPIGYVSSDFQEKADVPRQGSLGEGNRAVISLLPGRNFEQALEDLEGIERIWIVFWMDKVIHFKLKVQPPRSCGKKGVFATRSPHRPNPIGLSCVKLCAVKGLNLYIEDHDLLEGTPVLDIKPYLPYADSFPNSKVGWMEEKPESNKVCFSEKALHDLAFLKEQSEVDLQNKLESRLRFFTQPSSSNRIKHLEQDLYLLSYKFWRALIEKKVGDPFVYVLTVLNACDTKYLNI